MYADFESMVKVAMFIPSGVIRRSYRKAANGLLNKQLSIGKHMEKLNPLSPIYSKTVDKARRFAQGAIPASANPRKLASAKKAYDAYLRNMDKLRSETMGFRREYGASPFKSMLDGSIEAKMNNPLGLGNKEWLSQFNIDRARDLVGQKANTSMYLPPSFNANW